VPVMQSIYIGYPALADPVHVQLWSGQFMATEPKHLLFGLREFGGDVMWFASVPIV
jgi:hypothetical protein